MRANRDVIALTSLAAIESAGFLGNALPPLEEIEKNGYDADFRKGMRDAYVRAGGIGLAVGAILAYLTESWWPLVGAGVGAAGWICLTESALPPDFRLLGQPRLLEGC